MDLQNTQQLQEQQLHTENSKRYIVGFDVSDRYAQVSYMTFEGDEGEINNIPLAICKRHGARQWACGEEALKMAASGEGELVEGLFNKAVAGETVVFEQMEANPIELLAIYVKNVLAPTGIFDIDATVASFVICAKDLTDDVLQVFERLKELVFKDCESVFFITKQESLFQYTIHQPKSLSSYEVDVVDFTDGYLRLYRVEMNHKLRPILTTVEEIVLDEISIPEEFTSIVAKDQYLEMMDGKLCEILNAFLEGRIVTSIYLAGKIFEKEWCPKTIQLICKNRRVFGGSNLYSKGACLAAMEKIVPGEEAQDYIYLGKGILRHEVGVTLLDGGREVVQYLIRGGQSWFDAKAEFAFLPGEDGNLPIVIRPLGKREEQVHNLALPTFKDRDVKSMRFLTRLYFKSENELVVEVEDTGFGEFYRPSGKRYREVIFVN